MKKKNLKKKLRLIHLPYDIGGNPSGLNNFLNLNGLESNLLVILKNNFSYYKPNKILSKKDETRFLVGTPQTGGYGITLTAASTMIYYSNGYDLEKRTQSEARIDRIGQKFPMTYIDILAEDTVDERIVKALRKKINIATQVMGEELKDWI